MVILNTLKNLFGVAAILLSFWTALLTGFFVGPNIFKIFYGDGYKPAVFTIEKLNYITARNTAGTSRVSPSQHWADGTVAGRKEKYKLGGYLKGSINSLEDLTSQFKVGQKLPVLYNPEIPEHLGIRVQFPEKDFHDTWKKSQTKMIDTAYLPWLGAMVLCLLCGLLAGRAKSALGFCLGSFFLVAFSWFPTAIELWF